MAAWAAWCGDNLEAYRGSWTEDRIPENRDLAYAMATANTERMIYQAAEQDGSFDAMAILPVHVIGPLLTPNHDQRLELAELHEVHDGGAAL